ncbi:hypothetical protein [Paenibacillus alginolyticus]|uniref:hypothetical protein n=1 Tax=Paenibacillus alginolyticus TaxID=59839 RepID=UPI002DB73A18|nr:hypothetical protein [Paenibacillus alginolyticus]MEC0148109.1 hypothetical protein [Paenibacillus alginolyticus]
MGNHDHEHKGREHPDMQAAFPQVTRHLPPAIERLNELSFNFGSVGTMTPCSFLHRWIP